MSCTRSTALVLLALSAGMLMTARSSPAEEAQRDAQAPARPIALKAAHLFDSVSGKLVDGGVVIISGERIQAVGTGLAIPDAAVEPHGQNAHEFSLMVSNGLTPAQALIAGTASGADLLGLADRIGTLQRGKDADIVAVGGNPLASIDATEHPVFVMKQG